MGMQKFFFLMRSTFPGSSREAVRRPNKMWLIRSIIKEKQSGGPSRQNRIIFSLFTVDEPDCKDDMDGIGLWDLNYVLPQK